VFFIFTERGGGEESDLKTLGLVTVNTHHAMFDMYLLQYLYPSRAKKLWEDSHGPR
jgi:hypothetical protein